VELGEEIFDDGRDTSHNPYDAQNETTTVDVDVLVEEEKLDDVDDRREPPSRESSAAPIARRELKRAASETEDLAFDTARERKRSRDESEPFEEADSPANLSMSAGPKNIKERKRFQNVIYMLHNQISQHRNGTIFHHPIKPSEAPDYHEIVKRAVDLKTIKARVRDGQISNSSEYIRDIYLMFANSLMYNRPHSDIYNMAEEVCTTSSSFMFLCYSQSTTTADDARERRSYKYLPTDRGFCSDAALSGYLYSCSK